MTRSKAFVVPLLGIALILVVLAFGRMAHSPARLAAIGIGIAVLLIRAAMLYRKSRV
jgi:hypothetical protein